MREKLIIPKKEMREIFIQQLRDLLASDKRDIQWATAILSSLETILTHKLMAISETTRGKIDVLLDKVSAGNFSNTDINLLADLAQRAVNMYRVHYQKNDNHF